MKFGIGAPEPPPGTPGYRIAHPTKAGWEFEFSQRQPDGHVIVSAYREDTPAALPLVTASGRDFTRTMNALDRKIERWEADNR